MALTTQPRRAQFAYVIGTGVCPTIEGVEKATSTWTQGAFLRDDDAGRLTESTSPIDGAAGVEAQRTFALALDAATGTTGAKAQAVWLGDDVVLEITLSNATAGTHTLVQGNQWQTYPILKGTNNWYLDTNAVSDTGGGLVVGFKDPIGTVDARVYCRVTLPVRGSANDGSTTF